MTVSTSVGRKFTIDTIITIAFRRAGLVSITQTPRTAETQHGRLVLEEITDELAVFGTFARVSTFINVAITQGTTRYDLPSDVLDLLSPAMYIDPTNDDVDRADGETPIDLVREEEWTRYSSKAASGRPVKMYADRSATDDIVTAVLWPVPDEAGATVRFFVQRRLADTDDGGATLDLQTYWNSYIISRLAARLAMDSSLEARAASLDSVAERQLLYARGMANERSGNQIYVDHDTGSWHA
ncbi:MAG: hypothetical protein V3W41_13030 [Planctomycetota bacterium]